MSFTEFIANELEQLSLCIRVRLNCSASRGLQRPSRSRLDAEHRPPFARRCAQSSSSFLFPVRPTRCPSSSVGDSFCCQSQPRHQAISYKTRNTTVTPQQFKAKKRGTIDSGSVQEHHRQLCATAAAHTHTHSSRARLPPTPGWTAGPGGRAAGAGGPRACRRRRGPCRCRRRPVCLGWRVRVRIT